MLAVKKMALLGLVLTLAGLLIVIIVVPAWSNVQASLVTSPPGEDFHLPAGTPFKISCWTEGGGDGKGFTSMKWVNKDGEEIAEGNPGVQREGNSLLLIFTKPNVEESGVYKCLSTYGGEYALEKQVQISFYGSKPDFISSFQETTVEEDSFVELLCQATGEQPITYKWYNPYENEITEGTNKPIFVTNNINGSVLTIRHVDKNDDGIYVCRAANTHGLSSKLYQLTVLPKNFPGNETTNVTDDIQNITVLEVTSKSSRFYLRLSGDARTIQVSYSELRNKTKLSLLWRFEDDFMVKDLIPGGLYTFIFRVLPEGKWTRPINVTLLPDIPEVVFQSIEQGNVKLQWMRTFDDIMRETIDKYELSYRSVQMRGGSSWEFNQCAVTVTIPSCAGSSYTFSGLSRRSYYEIQLKAHTIAGYGEPYRQKIYISE